MNEKVLIAGLVVVLSIFNARAEPGVTYTLTGEEKSVEEIIKADMAQHPILYQGETLDSYLPKFKTENKIGEQKLSSGDQLNFPETPTSLELGELYQIALEFAKEFGIEEVQSIEKGDRYIPTMGLVVKGDEKTENGRGQFKRLVVGLGNGNEKRSRSWNEKKCLTDCQFTIVEFVEIQIQEEINHVIISRVSAIVATNILNEFYRRSRAYSSSDKKRLSKEQVMNPFILQYDPDGDEYELRTKERLHIFFTKEESGIVIQRYRYRNWG